MSTKTFVLDTNVLLHSAQSLESFQDNDIVLPMAVIEELDKFKKYQDELGRNARQVIRTLDSLRENGHLGEGVSLIVSKWELPYWSEAVELVDLTPQIVALIDPSDRALMLVDQMKASPPAPMEHSFPAKTYVATSVRRPYSRL